MTEVKQYTVKTGDCAWTVAKRNIQVKNNNAKITNTQIMKEMERLAKLNNCNSVNDFSAKYFNNIGKKLILEQETPSNNNTATATNTPQVKKQSPEIKKTNTPKTEIQRINEMPNDLTKIIQYNKKNYKGNFYGVVDKKTCQLMIFDKSGKVVKRITVGIGKTKGDGLSNYYQDHYKHTSDAYKAESNRFTTPGEFTLDEAPGNPNHKGYMGNDGTYRSMGLKGDNRGVRSGQQAIHVVYNNDPNRIKGIKSKGTEDNRMSYGCVNLLQEDYDTMHKYLGEGDKIFILPEEKGNSLKLEKQADGTYVFHQQYHKQDKRDISIARASQVKYDVRPDKAPKSKKPQGAPKKTQTVASQQPQKEFHILQPSTWKNLFS